MIEKPHTITLPTRRELEISLRDLLSDSKVSWLSTSGLGRKV